MQQAITNSTRIQNMDSKAPTARTAGLARRVAGRWDLAGVLTLMGSSAAYGVFALLHLGL